MLKHFSHYFQRLDSNQALFVIEQFNEFPQILTFKSWCFSYFRSTKVLFQELKAVNPDFIVGVPAYVLNKPKNIGLFVKADLSNLPSETDSETVSFFAFGKGIFQGWQFHDDGKGYSNDIV